MTITTPSATYEHSTPEPSGFQIMSESEELRLKLDMIENLPQFKAFVNRLNRSRYHTRHGYSARILLRAFFMKNFLSEPFNKGMISRLRFSSDLREICGITKRVPSEGTFCRFFRILSADTTMLESVLPTIVEELHSYEELPDIGKGVAIDSTDIASWANPHVSEEARTDRTAQPGHRTFKSKAYKEGKTGEKFLGYKVHALTDTVYGIPLTYIVLPANTHDMTMLPVVVDKGLATYDWLAPDFLTADRGYDSMKNHKYLYEQKGIIPIILMTRPAKRKGVQTLYDGKYDHLGRPMCIDGKTPMDWVETNPQTGKHLYRCPPGGCAPSERNSGATLFCIPKGTQWEDPADNLRVISIFARSSRRWSEHYSHRQTIERMFGSLKRSLTLSRHQYLTESKVRAHIAMAFIAYAVTMLIRVRHQGVDRIRQMKLRSSEMCGKS